jgi:hypothetical protein
MGKTIALLTDFGTHDPYVGVMKGVMRGICPDCDFIDITHNIAPQHVRAAAFNLMNAYDYFPPGTIFLVVVDPGVGSIRLPVAVRTGGYTFIAPDNGVLSYVLGQQDDYEAHVLENPAMRLESVSHTFHGRDIFSPAAAHLAAGADLASVGPAHTDLVRLPLPELTVSGRSITGEVLHIDRFGNIITSIGRMDWLTQERLTLSPMFGDTSVRAVPVNAPDASVIVHGLTIRSIQRAYSDALRGDVVALVGSSNYLEIAVNQGNAADRLDTAVGDRVEVRLGDIDAAIRD